VGHDESHRHCDDHLGCHCHTVCAHQEDGKQRRCQWQTEHSGAHGSDPGGDPGRQIHARQCTRGDTERRADEH